MVNAILPPGADDLIPPESWPKTMRIAYRYKTPYTRKRDFDAAVARMSPEEMRSIRVREYSARGDGPETTLAEALERQRTRGYPRVAVCGPKGDFGGGRGAWSRRVDPGDLYPEPDEAPETPKP